MKDSIRINKYLSESGYCSRRKADELIKSKRVRINGAVSELGDKVSDKDVITVNGNVVSKESKRYVYIVFNKPKGIVCTTDSRREKNIKHRYHSKGSEPLKKLLRWPFI